MERRIDAVELLDGPLDDPAALAANLRDLRRINRWLGGTTISAAAIDALAAHRQDLTLLDIGTGGADIPIALLERARARGRRMSIVAIDSRPEILVAALRERSVAAVTEGLQLHVGDGRSLPYPDRSFDVTHASLVLHHCTPDEAAALLREMARVSRLGIVINDLDRGWLGWIGAWLLGHLLTGNRYTRHDAPLSVRRAYRAAEVAVMLRAAGLTPIRTIRGALGRRYAVAALPTPDLTDRDDLGDLGDPAHPPGPTGVGG